MLGGTCRSVAAVRGLLLPRPRGLISGNARERWNFTAVSLMRAPLRRAATGYQTMRPAQAGKSGIMFGMKQNAKRWNQRGEPKRACSIAVGSAMARGEEVATYVGAML